MEKKGQILRYQPHIKENSGGIFFRSFDQARAEQSKNGFRTIQSFKI